MRKTVTDDELDEAFKPKSNKEKLMVDKIKRNEKLYGVGFYNKPDRTSLKILNYHIKKIRDGQSVRFDLENVYLPTSIIIALCERAGIGYKIGMKNGNKRVLFIGER